MADGDELTLRHTGALVWRRRWIVLVGTVLTVVTAGIAVTLTTPEYRASVDVLVRRPPTATQVEATASSPGPRFIENELSAARGNTLETVVREVIGSEPRLSVESDDQSDIFTFVATSTNAENAALAARTHAQAYLDDQRRRVIGEFETRQTVVVEELAQIERGEGNPERLEEFQRNLQDIALSIELVRSIGSEIVDDAVVPDTPFEPTPVRTITLALVVGLLLGLGGAFVADHLDTSLRDADELAAVTGLPILATIPRLPPGTAPVLGGGGTSDSSAAESYRDLRTSLRFLALERPLGAVLVTSPKPGDGKTTTAVNLAAASAAAGQRTVLVDLDLRKPQVHSYFGIANDRGFTSALLDGDPLGEIAHAPPELVRLRVIPSGPLPPDPSELLSGDDAGRLLDELARGADAVIVDSPPVLAVTDPIVLSGLVGGVLLVVSADSTDRRQATRAMERLRQVDAPMLGAVFNGDSDRERDHYRYSYGYHRSSPVAASEVVADRESPAVEA